MAWRWIFLAVEAFMLLFLMLHDWIHLPPWTDARATRRVYTMSTNLRNTLLNSVPVAIALLLTIYYLSAAIPGWVRGYWILLYALLLLGEYRAWWHPYWFGWDPKRLARYRELFGNTHTIMPARGGMAPNTAHVLLHACTALAFVLSIALPS
ncbi:MAG: hypothetical protein IRZ33_05600 [Alicyclobacillaceae bacterium]|nr:hypothetical protein [Alicyclobacillaceae bacterium]